MLRVFQQLIHEAPASGGMLPGLSVPGWVDSFFLFCSVFNLPFVDLDQNRRMAELANYVSTTERHLVFNGVKLHRKAFLRKGTPSKANAAVIAGVLESELSDADSQAITGRMVHVKKGFKGYVNHFITSWWVQNAIDLGMTVRGTGARVQSYEDLVQELESNSTMKSFQNWYNVCYKDTDVKRDGKAEAEAKIMKNLGIKYDDGSTSGGCVGELLSDQLNKQLEKIQTRSRNKQRLHLVKSRPAVAKAGKGRKPGARRVAGEYYIVCSDSKNNPLEWHSFNVSEHAVLGFVATGC